MLPKYKKGLNEDSNLGPLGYEPNALTTTPFSLDSRTEGGLYEVHWGGSHTNSLILLMNKKRENVWDFQIQDGRREKKADPAGNRTPISRVTVEDTNHCTTRP